MGLRTVRPLRKPEYGRVAIRRVFTPGAVGVAAFQREVVVSLLLAGLDVELLSCWK